MQDVLTFHFTNQSLICWLVKSIKVCQANIERRRNERKNRKKRPPCLLVFLFGGHRKTMWRQRLSWVWGRMLLTAPYLVCSSSLSNPFETLLLKTGRTFKYHNCSVIKLAASLVSSEWLCLFTWCIYNIYRVSQEECEILRESVPYVKLYRYNPKHLCPKLNGYGDNGQRKVWTPCISAYCTSTAV